MKKLNEFKISKNKQNKQLSEKLKSLSKRDSKLLFLTIKFKYLGIVKIRRDNVCPFDYFTEILFMNYSDKKGRFVN